MTAAIGAEAAGAAGAETAGAGAAAGSAAPTAAPASSVGRTGTKPAGGGPSKRSGSSTRSRRPSSSSTRSRRSSSSSAPSGGSSKGPQALEAAKKAKRGARKALHHKPILGSKGKASGARRLLVAEFVLCALVVAFSPLTTAHKTDSQGALIKRLSALAALFLLLGLLASAGRGTARVAAAFGGVVTVTLMVSDREVFSVLASRFAPGVGSAVGGAAGPGAETISDGSTSQSGGVGSGIGGATGAIAGTGGGILGDIAGVAAGGLG